MDCNNSGFIPISPVPCFSGFTEFTPTIPKLYYGVKSQEQRILELCKMIDKLICYADMLGNQTNINIHDILELEAEFEKFKESGFEDYYEQQLAAWIDENMPNIISYAIRMVFFGLTEDGYFVAYIPDSWNEIQFDTGMDYSDKNTYGRLILDMYVTDTFQTVKGQPTELIWEVNNG